ncbi:MAG TPA: alcohol dehydrogenase catalytic domain-containing protein [Phycisphaerales bacterium]|nr:alcohol dehydrogenase catalytic domain-containing protein [Phycisphaerales bacterium]
MRPGEALVSPTRLAADAADALAVRGEFSGVLGHQFVGRVEAVDPSIGEPAARRLIGKRVVGSAHVPCGVCERCRSGLSLHCANAATLGLAGRDGCFAEAFTIPAANLVVVPDGMHDDRAVFAHTLGRVIHGARMLRVERKAYVSVLGDGPVALLAAQLMARRNASVRLLGTHAANLEICVKWGVKHRAQGDVGRRQDQDVVFDCTGSTESLELALALVRPRGAVVVMRANAPDATINGHLIMRDEVQVCGSRGSAVADAVAELASGSVDVLSLIARRMRFEEAPHAIAAAAEPGMLKILLDAA